MNKKHHKIFRTCDVILYYLCNLLLPIPTELGITVARQVHKIPAVVDEEMVDKLGLARCGGGHGQLVVAA